MKRIRNDAAIRDREELTAVVQATVQMQITREKQVAARDLRLEKIAKEFDPVITDLDAKVKLNMALVQQWAEKNPAEFGTLKSLKVAEHTIGFRKGNFAAKLRSRKFTWAQVVENLKAAGKELADKFVRTKEEANKEAMIAARATHEVELLKAGVEIEQEETFYLEPNREGQLPPTLHTAAKAA